MINHKALEPNRGNTWVIGDTHGFIKTLEALLDQLELEKSDRVIFLGDMVDRGPGSKQIFDLIMDYQSKGYDFVCIRGNHDDLMLQSYHEEMERGKGLLRFMKKDVIKRRWFTMGGDTTMKSFAAKRMIDIDPKYFDFLESTYHYVEDEKYLYVHAGFDFKREDPFDHVEPMMWIRDFKVNMELTKDKKVVHGHTPLDLEFIRDVISRPNIHNFIALDNGVMINNVIGKGNLLAFETKSDNLVVQASRDE